MKGEDFFSELKTFSCHNVHEMGLFSLIPEMLTLRALHLFVV